MSFGRSASLRLFRFIGVEVYLHWSWFLFAMWRINDRGHAYGFVGMAALELVVLFLILLAGAFSRVLATQKTGGRVKGILLWPLGCTTFTSPSPRHGTELWRIVAGPLVGVGLFIVFTGLVWLDGVPLIASSPLVMDDLDKFLRNIWLINTVVLIFNLLPVYPMDGGQILRVLLSSFLSRGRSLWGATFLGLLGAIGIGLWALSIQSILMGVAAVYLFTHCLKNWERAKVLVFLESKPQRKEFLCPSCQTHPPVGKFWRCHGCQASLDTFEAPDKCPHCHTASPTTPCPFCLESNPIADWTTEPQSVS